MYYEVEMVCDKGHKEIIEYVKKEMPDAEYGIHVHNDAELAVANSLVAIHLGIRHVQGTINGYGERCGNANLCSIIPSVELKMGLKCLPEGHLKKITSISRYIAEIANLSPFKRQPYVGESAFAHKGGIHVSAILANSRTYEHIPPEKVGNRQRVLLSDLSGKSNIIFKAKQYGLNLSKEDPLVLELLEQIKNMERIGYEFSVAEASFELLLNRTLGKVRKYYELIGFRVLDGRQKEIEDPISEATVMIRVGGSISHTAATGKGPVNALDNALRKGLEQFYPNLKEMKLLDFKVRVLTPKDPEYAGTASMVRVFIESGDQKDRWITVGVSYNIIEASWKALEDSVIYKLFKDDKEKNNSTAR
jgi:2-isopropylmalate synthase